MKLVLATGIPGSNRKEYLAGVERYAASREKRIKIYPVGQLMIEHARSIGFDIHEENILNADPDLLHSWRSVVFARILAEIAASSEQYDAAILLIHEFFLSGGWFEKAYDPALKQFNPDLFVTFIDNGPKILSRLSEREQYCDEHGDPTLTLNQVLQWQNIEVQVTSGRAADAGKPFFAVAVAQPASTLYRLAVHPEIEPVYIAMPISHLQKPRDRAGIDAFIKRLDKYFTVFNPLAVEAIGAVPLGDPNLDLLPYHHTVRRDLYWFVRQSKKIIVYWPKEIVSSPGVNHETHEAMVKTKDVLVIYPGALASPFITDFNTRLFRGEKDFFEFLDAKYPERKNLNWD